MTQPLRSADIVSVVVGTAGHIDHGKSTLVKRLTGIDPDRLPEEKAREMTIDLGFAPLVLRDGRRVGIIDVPGHERFIKNMVAGATSIDLVLLVVAADESINLQTREHVAIMSLLGLKRGIVVLTKADKADVDLRAVVADDVRELVKGTFLEGAPVHAVSSLTGEGIDGLVEELHRAVAEMPPHDASGVFRMPVQRVFSAKGFGTIVTGVPLSGRARIGDVLEILPGGKRGRIRALQAYKSEVEEIRAGHSSAINLSDFSIDDVRRGCVAAAPGYFKASSYVEARFRHLPDRPRPLRNLTPVKLHAGTAECDGRIVLLDCDELAPGQEGYVQFRLDEPVVVAPGDPFIVRLQTPTYTLGGGRILDVSDVKLRRLKDEVTLQLVEKEQALAGGTSPLENALRNAGPKTLSPQDLSVAAKLPPDAVAAGLPALEAKLVRFEGGRFLHAEAFEQALDRVAVAVEGFHVRNPLRPGVEVAALRNEAKLEPALFDRALTALVERGTLAREGDKVRRSSYSVKLSREDSDCVAEIERVYRETRFATPRAEELTERAPKYSADRLARMLALLVDGGTLLKLKDGVILHRDAAAEAAALVAKEIGERGPMEAGRFRDLTGASRKYLIPILEHLDALGLTRREGNARVLRKK